MDLNFISLHATVKLRCNMMQHSRNNGYRCTYTQKQDRRKQWNINKSPSVVSRTSLPSGSTPVGTLQQGSNMPTPEIKHCRLLHPFAQQDEQQVAYCLKQKNMVNVNKHPCHDLLVSHLKSINGLF